MTAGMWLVASSARAQCPIDMVPSGSTCVDKFEASLWKITDSTCARFIKSGLPPPRFCLDHAVQLGINGVDYVDGTCQFNGGGCKDIYALSLPAVIPARSINYFIAAAACRNSGKRLPSNAEWQAAALGTPDPWPQDDPANQCNLTGSSAALTGSRSKCVSDVGAFDMVGNVIEFVADWGPLATTGTTWDAFIPGFGGDVSNIGGSPAGTIYGLPGTTLRGGSFAFGSGGFGQLAGVYAIDQNGAPNSIGDATAAGFRCAK
jgi:formylglycine-generating enzyme required for sulfatase activity